MKVIGPQKTNSGLEFGVIREFKGPFGMFERRFRITYHEATNKWFHDSFDGEEGLCRERLFLPRRDCACIRACKEKVN